MDDYVLIERPAPGHENYVLRKLVNRYESKDFNYTLVLHINKTRHYICGLFRIMRECLIARYYANTGLGGAEGMSDDHFFQAHEKDGPIVPFIYDQEHNTVREL